MTTKLPIVVDNLIEDCLQNQIEDSMFDCTWRFQMDNTYSYSKSTNGYRKFLSPFQYDISPCINTNILQNQKTFRLINKVIKKCCDHIDFNIEGMHRCIAGIQGVQVIKKKSKVGAIHVNQQRPHLVFLYYVNDVDGETILYDKTTDDIDSYDQIYLDEKYQFNVVDKIMPKKGRILLFDGKTYHFSSSPTTGIRCIVTLDLYGEFRDGSYKFPPPEEKSIKSNFKYQ